MTFRKKIKNSLTLLSLLFVFTFYAQEKEKKLINEIKSELYTNPLQAKKKSHKLLKIIKGKNLKKTESNAYYFLAELSGTLSEKDSCLYYYEKAIQKANELKDDNLVLMYKINKANYLFNEFDFESALKLYDDALTIAVELKNDYFIDYLNLKKGSVYMETSKYQEALQIFKNCLKHDSFDPPTQLGLYLNLSKTYLKLEHIDSSYYYLNEGFKKVNNNKEFKIHFLNQESLILMDQKNFFESEDKLNQAIKIADDLSYLEMKRLLLINLAKVKTLKNEHLKSVQILSKILENKEKIAIASENLYEIYYLLAHNYKEMDSLSLSNDNYERFINESKKLGDKKIKNIDLLQKINLKEIKSEKISLIYQKWFLLSLVFILLILLILYIIKKRKAEIENDKKFRLLIEKINKHEISHHNILKQETLNSNSWDEQKNIALEEENKPQTLKPKSENNETPINDEIVKKILEDLIKLEEKKYFLKANYSLNYVAKKLKTNTAYLSKVINNELGMSFSTYINELRINYIILELKNNKKLRSYSIKSISEEIGYKSPESFNKYFKAKTGITPSLFIKKIQNEKT